MLPSLLLVVPTGGRVVGGICPPDLVFRFAAEFFIAKGSLKTLVKVHTALVVTIV